MMRRILACLALAVLAISSSIRPASAVASLQVAPLKYQATLHAGAPQQGTITVSNPGDAAIAVQSQIQAIRQTGSDGALQYYDDPAIAAGIGISHDTVRIPPRQSVNFVFQLNPDKLPQRGVYAVIFFRTVPPEVSSGTHISQSVRVGTLLLLQNGTAGHRQGSIISFSGPHFVYGNAIHGSATYRNTGAVAFNPHLSLRTGPGTDGQVVAAPYVLPDAERSFPVVATGSRLGLVRLHLVDTQSGSSRTLTVWAVTGVWCWLVPVVTCLVLAGALWLWITRLHRHKVHYRSVL